VSHAEVIRLNNGDTLNVIIKHQTDDSLIVEHTSLGEITISKGKVANLQQINLHNIKKQASQQVAQTSDQKPVDEGLFGTGFLTAWDRSIDIGLNGASGPSNNASFRVGVNGHYEDSEDRWDFKSVYILKTEDEETTDHLFKADLLKDWFISDSARFYFAHAGFDWDAFKDWDYRGRLAGGTGYQFIKNEEWEFATRVGLSGIYEVMEPDNNARLEGLVGLDLSWKISDKQSFKLSNIFFPGITEAGEYRNVTQFEWVHNLDFYKGLALKVGFDNEYDTTQTEKNDLKYHAAIAWGL
jgi:putative salt-induced outer membrane protein YdiY